MTKELLKEVLGMYATPYDIVLKDSKVLFTWDNSSGSADDAINVYQLAHMCKEWAKHKGYNLYSSVGGLLSPIDGGYVELKRYSLVSEYYGETEPEAIFKACGWILEQEEK